MVGPVKFPYQSLHSRLTERLLEGACFGSYLLFVRQINGARSYRFVKVPDAGRYMDMLNADNVSPLSVPTSHDSMHIRLREHHCLEPDTPLSPGRDAFDWGNDFLNAWIPREAKFRKHGVREMERL